MNDKLRTFGFFCLLNVTPSDVLFTAVLLVVLLAVDCRDDVCAADGLSAES